MQHTLKLSTNPTIPCPQNVTLAELSAWLCWCSRRSMLQLGLCLAMVIGPGPGCLAVSSCAWPWLCPLGLTLTPTSGPTVQPRLHQFRPQDRLSLPFCIPCSPAAAVGWTWLVTPCLATPREPLIPPAPWPKKLLAPAIL